MPAERVAALYAARWSVELLFREWKASYRLDDLPSRKPHVVESLLQASILTLAASRTLHRALAARMKRLAHRLPEERWAALFAEVAHELLRVLVGPRALRRVLARGVERFLTNEAVDPNAGRRLLLARIAAGGALWNGAM